ncbi:uncharacterized protein LOC119870286 isoform X2 [Canis lupus familiaris]|uniref:uncharacterized protein LOC119870286 isoform X2 n=1 Tax=Canis lupus familiaris TaxID=9615 RepID=UPI0018F38169|nr:uncharacterized protein LOC119870286 isoform X2 [Canis lupus familiaris]
MRRLESSWKGPRSRGCRKALGEETSGGRLCVFTGRRSSPGAPAPGAPQIPPTQPEERLQKAPCQRLRLRSAGVSELEGGTARSARRIGSPSLRSPLLGRKSPSARGAAAAARSSRCGGCRARRPSPQQPS